MDLKPVIVANPHPLVGDGRKYSYVTFLKGETLGDYLARTGFDVGRGPKSVYLNGERVPDDKWLLLLPGTGDQIVIRTRATGGNGGKVLRVVAMVALTIVSAGYGAALGGALGFTGTTAAAVGSSLIMIGGSILIGALLPPPKASLTGNKEKEQSPTYGISAGRNSYNSYGPMIVVFGKHKVVPYFATKPYTTFSGNDQFLSQAFHFGLQPDLDLQAIRIGNTDITNYRDVEINRSTYDGKLTLVAGNLDTVDGFELANADGWTQRTTPRDTQHISVDVAANLYSIADDGEEESVTVQFEAQYKAVASAEWLPMGGYYETRASHYWSLGRWTTEESIFGGKQVWQQVQYGSINQNDHTENEPVEICHDRFVPMKGKVRTCETYFWRWVPYGMLPWQGRGPDPVTGHTGTGISQLSGSDSQKPARMTLEVGVAAGEYDVRFRKISEDMTSSRSSNKLTIAQIRCTQTDNADYSGQCRLAVRIKATSQLNGAVDSLSAIASAKTLVWQNNAWVQAYTSNPAWWYLFWARGMRDQDFNRLYGECLPDSKIDLEAIKSWAAWCDAKGLTFNWVLDRKMSIDDVYHVIARAGRASKSMHGGKLSVIWDSADIPESNFVTPENIVAGSFEYKFINTEVTDEIIVNFFNQEKDFEPDVVRQKVPGAVQVNNPVTFDLEGCTVADQAGREANLMAASQYFHRQQFSWEMDIEGATITRGDVVRMTHDLTSWGASGRIMAYENGQLTLDSYVEPIENAWMSIRSPNNKIANVRVSPVVGGEGDKLVIVGGWPQDADGNDLIPQPNNDEIDYIWQYNPTATPGRKVQIKSVRPSGRRNVKFEAIEYSREYHESEDNAYIHIPTGNGTKALINVFGITASERIVDEVTGRVEVTFTWVLSEKSDSDVHLYVNGEPFDSFGTPRYMTTITAVQGDIIDIEVRPTKENRGVPERYQYTVNGTLFQIPAIQSLTTTPEIFAIRLNWSIPPVNYIQRTEVWYSETPALTSAQKLTDLAYPQQEYRQAGIRAGQAFYYWVRLVDRFGNIGPFYPTGNGVRGVSSTVVADYMELFKDEFVNSEIGQKLQDDIAIINGDASTPGSIAHEVGSAVDAAKTEINGEIEDAKAQIQDVRDSVQVVSGDLLAEIDNRVAQGQQLATDIDAETAARTAAITGVKSDIDSQIAAVRGEVGYVSEDVANLTTEHNNFKAEAQTKFEAFASEDLALAAKTSVLEAKTNINANLLPNGGFENGAVGWLSMEVVNSALAFLPLENSQAFALVQGSKWGNFIKEVTTAGQLISPPITMSWADLNAQKLCASADIDPNINTTGPAFAAFGASLFVISPSSGNALNVKYGDNPGIQIDGFSGSDSERYKSPSILPAANGCTEAEFNNFFAAHPDAALRLIVSVNPRASDALVAFRRIKLELGATPTPYTADATLQSAHARISEESAIRVTNEQAAAVRMEAVETGLGDLTSTVTDVASSVTDLEQTTATRISKVEAKTNIKPNLLPNGGFESGLDGWTGFGYWDVVDDPHVGRYISMKPQYMAAIGSQTSAFYLSGIQPGQQFTMALDGFVKADSGTLGFDFRFRDAANAMLLQAPSVYIRKEYPEFSIDDSRRYQSGFSTTAIAPAGTVSVEVRFYKLGTGTNITGMGVRRIKFEAGANPTPYTADTSLVNANARITSMNTTVVDLQANKADATALDVVAADVAGNAASIAQTRQAVTDLESSTATDIDAIKAQVTGGSDTTDPSQLASGLVYNMRRAFATETEALAESISNLSVGMGEGYDSFRNWDFDADLEGWTPYGGTLQKTTVGVKIAHGTVANSGMISPYSQGIVGGQYHLIKARVRRLAGTGWEGGAYYSTGSHGHVTTRRKLIAEPDWTPGWVVLEWEMAELSEGGNDWIDNTISSIRLDLGNAAGDEFEVDYVTVGRPGPAASRADVKRAEQAAATANQATATRVDVLEAEINTPTTGMKAQVQRNTTALNSAIEGSLANDVLKLTAEYNTNKAAVTQDLLAHTNELESAASRLDSVEALAANNESDISQLFTAVSTQEQALAEFETEIQAKTNIGANLLTNGGFENGLEGWLVPAYWEVIDSPIYGRHVQMKAQYLNAASSQVTYQIITGLVPGMKVTYSGDFYVDYLGTPNTGSIGASIQFYAGSTMISNHALSMTNLTVFNDALRYERALTVEVPAGTTATRVRFYKIGTGSNIKGMGARRLKLELGEQATAYTAEGTLTEAHARINQTNTALTNAEQSFASQLNQVQTRFDDKVADVQNEITVVADDLSAVAQDVTRIEAKTNPNPNLVPNGGFELGTEGWTNIAFEIVDDPILGRCAMVKPANLNDGVTRTLTTRKFPAKGGQLYTLTSDAHYAATAGASFTVIARVYNAAGTFLTQYSIAYPRGTVFSENDTTRYGKRLTFTAHADAAAFDIMVRKAPDVSGGTRIGVRRIKLEPGSVATPYSAEGSLSDANAKIEAERVARTEAYDSMAADLVTVKAEVDDNAAAIQAETVARTTNEESVASQIIQLNATASKTRSYRQATAPTAATVPPPAVGDLWYNTAAGKNNEVSRYSGSTWQSVTDPRTAQNAADIVTERNTRADALGAMAQDISTVQAKADSADGKADQAVASAQTNSEAIVEANGRMSATITQKLQILANGTRVVAGTGAGIEYDPDTGSFQSSYNVWADRFAVWSGSGTELFSPFVVSNGQVFINDAVIGKLTADKITGGTYNVGGANGYGCIRTSGKVFSDGKNGFFFETLANGNASMDLVSNNCRIYMTPTQMGIVTPMFEAYSDGNVQIKGTAVINRLQLAHGSVTVGNNYAVDVPIPGGTPGGTWLWSANLGNTEPCVAVIICHYNFGSGAPNQANKQFWVGGNLLIEKNIAVGDWSDRKVMVLDSIPANAQVVLKLPDSGNSTPTSQNAAISATILTFFR